MIAILTIGFFLILNFGISVFNAWSVGKVLPEIKAMGGFPKIFVYSAIVMSVCGFTWVYLFIITFIMGTVGILGDAEVLAMLELGYLVIIFPVLGAGLILTVGSYITLWKQRNFKSGAIAGWNTFAMAYNTYNAVRLVPKSVTSVLKTFGSGNKNKNTIIILGLIFAIFGGGLTAYAIMRWSAKKHSQKMISKHNL